MSIREDEIKEVYEWVDTFPLSKIKRNIARDFSDGVLLLEILRAFYPSSVWLNTIVQANSKRDKTTNWDYLRSELIRKSLQKGKLFAHRFRN